MLVHLRKASAIGFWQELDRSLKVDSHRKFVIPVLWASIEVVTHLGEISCFGLLFRLTCLK